MKHQHQPSKSSDAPGEAGGDARQPRPVEKEKEIGGPQGPEPTRYGDWERKGRCIDF